MLRVRPLPYEATASYLNRLADTYRLPLPQLLDGVGITLNGHGTPPTAELRFNHNACHRLATWTRIRMPDPGRALPHPTHDSEPAAAYWTPLETGQHPVRACTLCTRHRSRDATDTAWVHQPPHRLVCPRHHQAAPDPRLAAPLRTETAPELAAAHHTHQRLLRHPRAHTAWTAARAITTRWYDHQHHLTHRWHGRLHQLHTANPHLIGAGSASPALLTRNLTTYPETIALARALTALPNQPHHDTRAHLAFIAHQLGLPHFTPAAHDPLHALLTHTRR